MAKATSKVTKTDHCAKSPGGNFEITIDVDSVVVTESSVKGKLSASYATCKKIDEAIIRVLGGVRKDQDFSDILSGSLLVSLQCFTDERFSEVFKDIESGRIQLKLAKEFGKFGIETKNLVVRIKNTEEVNEIKESISRRQGNKKIKNQKQEDATGSKSETSPQIIVQGGAYFQKPSNIITDDEYVEIIENSARTGYEVLMGGGTAIDAVEKAINVLEKSEYFNSGFGSLLNCDGEVECDAMIMDGNTLSSGVVISGRHFKNPVSLAKLIMNNTDHCALSGDGALKFAVEKGFPIFDQNELIAEYPKETKKSYTKFGDYVRERFKPKGSDTVSAVARDKNGHFACGMSTGGVPGRLKGRVSDAPMVGCGGYANEHGAATTSGLGECLMKMTLAREVVYKMESGQTAQESAENALYKMRKQFEHSGLGGVIAIDEEGNFGKAFTTDMMGWASIKDDDLKSGLYEEMKIELGRCDNNRI